MGGGRPPAMPQGSSVLPPESSQHKCWGVSSPSSNRDRARPPCSSVQMSYGEGTCYSSPLGSSSKPVAEAWGGTDPVGQVPWRSGTVQVNHRRYGLGGRARTPCSPPSPSTEAPVSMWHHIVSCIPAGGIRNGSGAALSPHLRSSTKALCCSSHTRGQHMG